MHIDKKNLKKSERISQQIETLSLVWQPSRAQTRWSEQGTGVPPCVPIACDFAIIQAVNLRFRLRWDVLIFLSCQSGRLSGPDQDTCRTWTRDRAMRSRRTCHLTRTPGQVASFCQVPLGLDAWCNEMFYIYQLGHVNDTKNFRSRYFIYTICHLTIQIGFVRTNRIHARDKLAVCRFR